MPNLYIVAGRQGTRKSALIRCLTGVFKKRTYDIESINGVVTNFYIQIRSLQEADITANDFITTINTANYTNVICAIRIDPNRNLPGLDRYINSFIGARFSISQIVGLGIQQLTNLPNGCPQPIFFSNPKSIPTNNIASQVRQTWQFK